jgi:hypothetical protein
MARRGVFTPAAVALTALALTGVLLLLAAPSGRAGAGRAELKEAADARAASRPALTQKLEDVFSAPLDALAGYVRRVEGLPDVHMRPTSPAPGATLGVATAAGAPMAITVDSLPDARGRVQVHGLEGGRLYAGKVLLQPEGDAPDRPALASYFHEQANAGKPQGPSSRGWGLPGMGGWGQTGNWGDSGRLRAEHGNFDGHRSAVRLPVGVHPYVKHHGEPWSGVRRERERGREGSVGGRTNDFQVISTGPLTPEGYRTQVGTKYSKTESEPLPVAPPPSGWYPYNAPLGKVAETHFASIRVDGYPCGSPGTPACQGKAHLKLDVFCPPYVAPAHGSVWYKGKEHFEATATAPASREMIHLPVGGKCPDGSGDCGKGGGGVPLAVVGVDIPEGESVQVACNEHWRLTTEGSEFPRCLKSGEFERGKKCEPIMCSAYTPPENGGVWPDEPVQAGTRVTIYCFEGYEEDYDDYWPFQQNLPRAGFDSSGTRINKAQTSTLKGLARARAAMARLLRRAGGAPGSAGTGGSAGASAVASAGLGRVRHPDMAALMRAKAAARVRRRNEDRKRLPPAGLPVIPMDDVMAGSQKTLDAMVRSFVATGDAGFEPGWSDKRLTYDEARGDEARGKEPARPAGSPSASSSYALETLTGGEGGGEHERRARVEAALRKQNLEAEAQGLNDKYGYAVKAALNPHLDEDYKYALLDAAEGADDRILAAMDSPPSSSTPPDAPSTRSDAPPAAASREGGGAAGGRRLLAVAQEELAGADSSAGGSKLGRRRKRNPPVYRSRANRDKWRNMFGSVGHWRRDDQGQRVWKEKADQEDWGGEAGRGRRGTGGLGSSGESRHALTNVCVYRLYIVNVARS